MSIMSLVDTFYLTAINTAALLISNVILNYKITVKIEKRSPIE